MRKNASRNAVIRRHLRLRKKISGTAACPRLNVFSSLANIYAQRPTSSKKLKLNSHTAATQKLQKQSARW